MRRLIDQGTIRDPTPELFDSDNDANPDHEISLMQLHQRVQQEAGLVFDIGTATGTTTTMSTMHGPRGREHVSNTQNSVPTIDRPDGLELQRRISFMTVAGAWIRSSRARPKELGMTIITHNGNGRFSVIDHDPEEWQHFHNDYIVDALNEQV